jgi:S-(hydroxymethyl)glutathione dehydrogenase / alcohol dehydrogenase
MKALVYHGAYTVRVDDKPKPTIQDPEDIILKVTTTGICGSDLHLYHGMVPAMQPGQTLGHEFMGIVAEAGPEVHEVKEGDRVVIPFNISCGKCWYCQNDLWSQCDRAGPIGGAYGYGQEMGGYEGGQAEYVRVPFANTGPLKVPDTLTDEQVIFLTDILCTGYFGVDLADVQPGDDVAVFGAGPVGYFAVMSAFLRGAAQVFAVDHWPDRLQKVQELGAIPVNFNEENPVQTIMDETKGMGAVCVEAVGFEAMREKAPADKDQPNNPTNPIQVINWISEAARRYSAVGIVGVYGAAMSQFPLGTFFNREIQLHMGQCPVKKYNRRLLHLIETGRIDPTRIISHVMKLDEGPAAYEIFNRKDATKILLKPDGSRR